MNQLSYKVSSEKVKKMQIFNLEELRIPYEEGSAYANKGWSKNAKY